jgi:hypothetical protein
MSARAASSASASAAPGAGPSAPGPPPGKPGPPPKPPGANPAGGDAFYSPRDMVSLPGGLSLPGGAAPPPPGAPPPLLGADTAPSRATLDTANDEERERERLDDAFYLAV